MTVATRKEASRLDLGSGAYYAAYDVYYPIKGLIAVKKNERGAILLFDDMENSDFFVSVLSKQDRFVSLEAFQEVFNNLSMNPYFGHLNPAKGPWSRSLKPKLNFVCSSNAFDYLMSQWKGNDEAPVANGFSHRAFVNRDSRIVPMKSPKLTVSIDPETPSALPTSQVPTLVTEPPVPSSRTKKSFVFPKPDVSKPASPSSSSASSSKVQSVTISVRSEDENKETATPVGKKSFCKTIQCWGKRKRLPSPA